MNPLSGGTLMVSLQKEGCHMISSTFPAAPKPFDLTNLVALPLKFLGHGLQNRFRQRAQKVLGVSKTEICLISRLGL